MEVVQENGKELLCRGSDVHPGCGSKLLVLASDITERNDFDCDGDPCGKVKGFNCPICKAFTDVDMKEFSGKTE